MNHYGIQGPLHTWIENWLTHRTQAVVIDGEQSTDGTVSSQGTVLRRLMFLLCINDINNQITSSMKLFASDCVVYHTVDCPDGALALQVDINQLCVWANTWQMQFNTHKCTVMWIAQKKSNFIHTYTMSGNIMVGISV